MTAQRDDLTAQSSADPTAGRNPAFWDELCGSAAARTLGLVDASAESLRRFDDWYFGYYPYLARHIPFDSVHGRDVLEVGLGYGSVAERLARSGARYTGLDIAAAPVAMARYRLTLAGLAGTARQGSVLACPFDDESFDLVVAIGCYHHTGDLARALDETWRVLRPGGQCALMVYYAYSYRRWLDWPRATLAHLCRDLGLVRDVPRASEVERRAYDANAGGDPAPETAFVSRRELRRLSARFSEFHAVTENATLSGAFQRIPRSLGLATLGRGLGLDLYARLRK